MNFYRIMVALLLSGQLFAQEDESSANEAAEALPVWEEKLLTEVKEGVFVPGSSLMGSLAREILFSGDEGPIELDTSIEEEGEDVEPEKEWPVIIASEYHEAYFRSYPSGYLMDPQNLLTPQEKGDLEGFFAYFAEDSSIDIYFYLFDAKQELPEGENPERIIADYLNYLGPSVVVFYYLGIPERTQIAYSSVLQNTATEEEKSEALIRSVEEALDRSGAFAQIESFSEQLSTRLYWLEKEIGNLAEDKKGLLYSLGELEVEEAQQLGFLEKIWHSPLARKIAGTVTLLLFAAGSAFFAKWMVERKRVYVFPESQGNLLLEAPHAAGVGAVIAYDSTKVPPSLQRDDVPDYLQKM